VTHLIWKETVTKEHTSGINNCTFHILGIEEKEEEEGYVVCKI
jgi:hypothetical protein